MTLLRAAPALLMAVLLGGCTAVVAGTAGGLIVDEGIIENDGVFDPLENTEASRTIRSWLD